MCALEHHYFEMVTVPFTCGLSPVGGLSERADECKPHEGLAIRLDSDLLDSYAYRDVARIEEGGQPKPPLEGIVSANVELAPTVL